MFSFMRNERTYTEIRAKVCSDAEFESQRMDLEPDQLLVEAFKKGGLSMTGNPMMGKRKACMRAPAQLKGVIDILLSYPPVLSAWLVRYHITKALDMANLPVHVQGDLMMSLENANYVLPKKADAEAVLLAYALCMQPSLRRARSALLGLGTPLTEAPISGSECQTAAGQGFLPPDFKPTGQKTILLGWNCEMRAKVFDALEQVDPRLSELMKLEKLRRIKKRPLERRRGKPNAEAAIMLKRGIELAGQGQFEQAYGLLEQAGQQDLELLPDVLRNQEWILSKQGKYAEAAIFARKALELAPDYAEIWYALGIDLAKLGQYGEALSAYQKAKKLGHRSKGLEHNIEVCKRACVN